MTAQNPVRTDLHHDEPVLELHDVGKTYGNVNALRGVNIRVWQGEVTCVLGDNGAGKSTLIKIIAGLHDYTEGTMKVNGIVRRFGSPRVAQATGIATVYLDLALATLMSVWRNFFLANEIRRGPFLDISTMRRICDEELTKMGIVIADLDRPVGSLSGGQRQCAAIARAIYFGARVLILDEPTAALGVKQSGVVLKYIVRARDAGLGVIFITHNPHHAYLVGNHFVILKLGQVVLDAHRDDLTLEQLTAEMAGGQELTELSHELRTADPGKVVAAQKVTHGAVPTNRTTNRTTNRVFATSVGDVPRHVHDDDAEDDDPHADDGPHGQALGEQQRSTDGGADRAERGPHGVGRPDREVLQGLREQDEGHRVADHDQDGRPELGEPFTRPKGQGAHHLGADRQQQVRPSTHVPTSGSDLLRL
jgi:simple sugar transport system ATP-binding protein